MENLERELNMSNETCENKTINKSVMKIIRGSIIKSMIAVCSMDLIMEHNINLTYLLSNVALLYFISD